MSLKENLDMVKEELNSEEKMLENAIKAEKYYKKYKKPLYGLLAAIVIGVASNAVYQNSVENKIQKSNELFDIVQKNPTNITAADELKALNPKLYQAWEFAEALRNKNVQKLNALSQQGLDVLSSIASYEVASREADITKLENYTLEQKAIYRDLALIEAAYLLMKENKIDEGHQQLMMIPSESPLYKISQVLMHYGVK